MSASASVGELIVDIVGDLTGLRNTMTEAQNTMADVGKKLSSVGKNMSMTVTAPLLAAGGYMIKSAADFEQGMSNVKAVSNATGKEMEQLKSLALKMGADTKYSAGEAASGIEELAKAGLSTQQILDGGLKGALSLAAAGGLELADAAEIASTALNSFKNDNLNVQQAADILAGAANASATSVQEMKFSLAASASVASSVGMSFKDTSTALAVFAQNGLKGSDAGTSLKTMLMNLQPQTDKQTALFQKLGLSAADGSSKFFDQQGKLKGLSDIASTLQTSMKGLNDAQRLQAMETIFGSDAIRASNILFKEGAKGVNDMAAAMGKVGADQVAAEKMNNLNGALEQLKGSIETAAIQMGSLLLPTLKGMADHLTALTNSFMTLSPQTQTWIMVIGAIVAAVGPVLFILGSLITNFTVVAGAIGAIGAPVLIAIAAIAAVGAALYYLWTTNETFRTTITAAWEAIKVYAMQAFGVLKEFFVKWWPEISGTFDAAIKLVARIIEIGFEIIKKFWATWGEDIKTAFKLIWDILSSTVLTATTIIKNMIKLFLDILNGNWSGAWEDIKNIFGAAWDWLSDRQKNIKDAFLLVMSGLANGVKAIWEQIVTNIKGSINIIISVVNAMINKINSVRINIPKVDIPGVGSFGGNTISFPQIPNIPALATGTNYVPGDTLAMLHKGEAVVPKQYNPSAGGTDRPIQIFLDGRKIYDGIDSYLGSRLVGLGAT